MAVISKDLGAVTAYAAAVNRGYTGTKEEFETLMASYATVAQQAAESASNASQSATDASQSATDAETAKGTAQQAATDAQAAQASAQESAQSAQQSAQSASQSAQTAESAKDTAVDAVDGFASGAQQALDGVNQAGNNWKSLAQAKALDSEAWAVGQRDGEDVGAQDETYHNNAKYYALTAATDATTASDAAQTATTKAGEAAQSAEAAAESARTFTTDTTLTQSGQAADAKATGDVITELKNDLTLLDNHVRYEKENIIAENNIQTTSGSKINVANSEFNVSIANGASFRFRVSGTNLINVFALYYNEGGASKRFGFNLLPNTNYDYTAPEAITSLYIYVGETDAIGTGTLELTVTEVVFNNNSVDKKIADLEHTSDEMSVLRGDKWTLNKNDFTELCVHHDNFSRIMTGYEIGMNAGGSDIGNNYDWVTPSSYDDGLTVNNGATFSAGTRAYNYSLRKIVSENADNFMIETNAPKENAPVMFGFNVTDINNFTELEIRKVSSGYMLFVNDIRGGIIRQTVVNVTVNQIIAQVAQLYVVRGILYLVLDDRMCVSAYVGSLGNHVFLASYRSFNTHFDFVNVFSLIGRVAWNPNPTLDTGETNIPLKTVSANDGNYELQDTETRWSEYADHFTLHSTDELIHNGRRSEVSIAHMNLFKYNLRTIKVSFDVLFPSEYVDTEREDLFVQFHDRDGTYRGTVPFALYIKNNTINVNTSSTVKPKDDNTSVIIDLHRFDFCDVELGKWHHFEIECKERYEARQNPFLRITIDGITQFEYRKANCYNDLLGASPQYGIYKNNWGTGVTEFQRYFDNFKIEYC